jgi:hypothetical protein
LGSECGKQTIHYHVDHPSSSSFLPATQLHRSLAPSSSREEAISVDVATLDGLVAQGLVELEPEVLIKLDVQGFEERVIRGGRETFRKAAACIVEICLDSLFEGQPRFTDILGSLTELGFGFAGNLEQFAGEDGHVSVMDAVFVREPAVHPPTVERREAAAAHGMSPTHTSIR